MKGKNFSLKKAVGLLLLSGALLAVSACGSKEAVILDAEDMVLLEETQEEAGAGLTESGETGEQVEESTLFVHICGEVMAPGVYEFPTGSRIFEAVEAAGGFTAKAEKSYVNLAQLLEDGMQIEIPDQSAAMERERSEAEAEDGLVDLNTATLQELCTLPGVGQSKAESIIAYRESNGGFSKIEDIMKVDGIKEGMFAKIKDKICIR